MLTEYPHNPTVDAFDSKFRGLQIPMHRKPQRDTPVKLPSGTRVVSADNHWSISTDIFYERFPAHLKARAPRVGMKGDVIHFEVGGKSLIAPGFQRALAQYDGLHGSWQVEARLKDMDGEGIEKEIAFGNLVGCFYNERDLELREWIFRVYNQHIAEIGKQTKGRFNGVGLINFWDMDRVRDSIDELKSMGLRTFLLPLVGKDGDGKELLFAHPQMEPLWAAIEESGLPLCFHVGEFFQPGPGALGTSAMINFGPFRKNLGELIFGGIFDRHPGLQVVFAEAELNWIPGALQSATTIYESYRDSLEPQIEHHPRYYWHKHCYATFTHDPAGLRLLDVIGADRVMWSVDYPHHEGTFSYSRSVMADVAEAVGPDEARAILGGTAIRVFKLDG
jgi:predicted TIM-barrel fold metal-dependent hydrolase